MKIFIKNMVCDRCITSVENIFNNLQIPIQAVILGEADTVNNLSNEEINNLETKLEIAGFQIVKNATRQLIEKLKRTIILKISELDIADDFILSAYLSSQFNKDYSSLSKNFSQNENYTIEQFFILQKIEKVKELLLYDEFTLSEIAGKLGYKSVQHLSSQFKNTTGFTPTNFKKLKTSHRKALDKI